MARPFASLAFALLVSRVQGHASHDDDSDTITINDRTYSHTWRTKTSMAVKRSDMSATTIGDEIYLIGGCIGDQEWTSAEGGMYVCTAVTSRADKYIPATDSYVELPAAPRSRYRHAAAALGSSLYIIGGRDVQDALIAEVDVLDTAAGTWSTLSALLPNPTSDLAAVSYDGLIYTIGGYDIYYDDAAQAMQIFNPAESGYNAWSIGTSLIQGRGDHAAALVGSSVFVVGGFHHDNFDLALNHTESLDLSSAQATWTEQAEMSTSRGDKAAAVLNGMLHIVGGESKNSIGHSVPLMDVEVYDHEHDVWYMGGSIPTNRFRFSGAAVGNSIYIFGGQGFLQGSYGTAGSKYPVLDDVEEYEETEEQTLETDASGAPNGRGVYSAVFFCVTALLAV